MGLETLKRVLRQISIVSTVNQEPLDIDRRKVGQLLTTESRLDMAVGPLVVIDGIDRWSLDMTTVSREKSSSSEIVIAARPVGLSVRQLSGRGALRNDPLHLLTGDCGDQVEVLVVVQDREVSCFRDRGDECINHRYGCVLTSLG